MDPTLMLWACQYICYTENWKYLLTRLPNNPLTQLPINPITK
jgi:hypothetical protein